MHESKQAAELEEKLNALKAATGMRKDGLNDSKFSLSKDDDDKNGLYAALATGLGKDTSAKTNNGKWHIKSNALYITMVINLIILIACLIFLAVFSTQRFIELKPSPDVGNMASTRRYGIQSIRKSRII